MESNSLARYLVWEESPGNYRFDTDNKIKYLVYFENTNIFNDYNLLNPIYHFGFEPLNIDWRKLNLESKERMPYDEKVRNTIFYILEDFFKNNINSVFYVCDTQNERGRIRKIVFNKWMKEYKNKSIIKEDSFVKTKYNNFYFSIILDQKNNEKDKIIEAFHSFTRIVQSKDRPLQI